MDNFGDIADLVVTRIHRPHRRQSDSHLDSPGRDHLDIQSGLWPAFDLRRDSGRKNTREKSLKSGEGWFHFAQLNHFGS